MRTLADEWKEFETLVIPQSAPAMQRKEMRRAFYAGAQSLLQATVEIASADLSDDAGAAILEGYHDECRRFGNDIAHGRA